MHLKPRDSILEIQCKPVDGFSVLNFWCVLQKFGMLLKHWITQEEIVIGNDDAHSIYLYGFMNVHQCSSHGLLFDEKKFNLCTEETHGKLTKIKCLIFLRETLGIFWRALLTNDGEICIPSIPFVSSRENETAKDRKIALKFWDVETTRDYAEILKFEFDNEIMSEHFGNSRSLSIEWCSARFFPNPNNTELKEKNCNTL